MGWFRLVGLGLRRIKLKLELNLNFTQTTLFPFDKIDVCPFIPHQLTTMAKGEQVFSKGQLKKIIVIRKPSFLCLANRINDKQHAKLGG